MSSSYTANQYESAFKSHKLQNWTVPKHFKQRPSAAEGHTTFIATDRGHLLPGVKRGTTWSSFQGTWDLPKRIPPVHINPTARSLEGQDRLKTWGQSAFEAHGGSRVNSRTCNKTTDEEQIPVSSPAPDGQEPIGEKPLSQAQSRPETQQSQALSRPVTPQSHAESRPVTPQSHAESRPVTPQSHAESRPASQQHKAESRPTSQQNQAQSRPVSQPSRTG